MAAPAELPQVSRHRSVRAAYAVLGFVAVGIGGIGVVVPGLPTTVFFVVAAWAFSRSSPRFERWVLDLPGVGRLVRDHRDGLGMPRRAKVIACTMIVVACSLSAALGFGTWTPRLVVLAAGAVGIAWILVRVPTREVVLHQRQLPHGCSGVPSGPDPRPGPVGSAVGPPPGGSSAGGSGR